MTTLTWHRVEIYARKRIEDQRDVLETASDPARVLAAQAAISVWREILALPAEISDENIEPPQAGYA